MIIMKYIKQPNNLYTVFDDESGGIISINSTMDDILNIVINRAKQEVESSSMTVIKAASTISSYYGLAQTDIYLNQIGYNGTVDDFAKSIERGPVAVTEIDTTRKERWGRCPNCGMTLWYKERGDYSEFHYKCGCGQMITWSSIQWQTENTDYSRCDSRMPGALQVVLQQTSVDSFKSDSMIRFSDIVKSIPDIAIGEYVISQDKYDSSWSSDKYRRCDGRMMNSLLVVLDGIPENEFNDSLMIHIKDVQPFITDIQIGEYVILKDWFDEGFDSNLEDSYIRCPSDMDGALEVVEDSKSEKEFIQSSMIRINRIARFIPTITVGEYVIILEDYDIDYYNADSFVKCSANMPLSMAIVDDNTVINNYSKYIAYSISKKIINDSAIGESIIDERYYDTGWNQYDTVNFEYGLLVKGQTPPEGDTYRVIVADSTPMSEFDRSTMIKYSSALLLLPNSDLARLNNIEDAYGRYVLIDPV